MSPSADDRLERRYAELEGKNEQRKAATVRRGPVSLIAVCLGVALVVGITAAVDLRRLRTPEGTALAFVGAAVFGDCATYRQLAAEDLPDDDAFCLALLELTQQARERPDDVEIEVLSTVAGDPPGATALVRVRRGDDEQVVELPLVREGGELRVRRSPELCAALACP